MPPKKKRVNNKKLKGKKKEAAARAAATVSSSDEAGQAERTTQPPPNPREETKLEIDENEVEKIVLVLDKEENLEETLEWLRREDSHVHAWGLAKRMPHSAQALREKEIDPNLFAKVIGLRAGISGKDEDKDSKEVLYHLWEAVHQIYNGREQLRDTCWECSTVLEDTNNSYCKACFVAKYCGEDCQEVAWRSGHREKCSILKEATARCRKNNRTVDSMHAAGTGAFPKIQLNITFDMYLSREIASSKALYQNGKLPSMKVFYENLGRVVRGEFWVDADGLASTEYETNHSSEWDTADTIFDQFNNISIFLCNDHFGFFASKEGITEPSTLMTRTSFLEEVDVLRSNFGPLMTAEQYLDRYMTFTFGRSSRVRALRDLKEIAKESLRKDFHK